MRWNKSNKPADAPRMRTPSRRAAPRTRIRKPRPFDGRTREARRWKCLHEHYLALAGSRGAHEQLCRSLASMILKREALDAAIARGEPVDTLDLVRVCGLIARLMTKLGLTSDDEPIDATDQVLAAIRSRSAAEEAAR